MTKTEIVNMVDHYKIRQMRTDPDLPVYLTVEYATSWGCTLQKAQHLTEADRQRYAADFRPLVMRPVSEEIELKHISWRELFSIVGQDQYEGVFPGCDNRVYAITQEQWDELISLNGKLDAEHEEKKRAEEIEHIEWSIAQAETQMVDGKLPDREGAIKLRELYNNTNNEGGEGFAPHYYWQDEYNYMVEKLAQLKRERRK